MRHTQDICNTDPRCLKCGRGHFTRIWTNYGTITLATCAKCQGNNSVNYRSCAIFGSYSDSLNKSSKDSTSHSTKTITTYKAFSRKQYNEKHSSANVDSTPPDTEEQGNNTVTSQSQTVMTEASNRFYVFR